MSSRKYKKMASTAGFIKSNPTDFGAWENSIALYGDSCTWGYDIPDEQRLHNIIETDRTVNNFGYPGESNVHMLMRMLDHFEEQGGYPYMVVMGWSSPYRMAKFANQQIEPLGGWERNFQEVADNNKSQFQKYNLLLFETVRAMCKDKCKLFEWTFYSGSYSDKRIYYPDKLDVAKDGKHPGPKSIELVARKIEYEIW